MSDRPRRVLAALVMHETNTFSRVPTDLASFTRRSFYRDNEIAPAYRGTRSAMGATFEAADKYGWTLIHPVVASANPSGTVTTAAFEALAAMILDTIDRQGPVDGMLLHLQGAMVTEAHEDGEGALLARIRARIGPDVPIMVTLDLHANVTQAMCDRANALIAFRTYPHIDQYERAWQAADLLARTMAGEIAPRTVLARRPMLTGLDMGRTQKGPMAELIERADAVEAKGEALVVSICAGFQHADIHDIDPTVTVTTDGASPRAQAIAEAFMDYAWETRDYRGIEFVPIAEAIARARAAKPGDKPLVIADYTDNPGGGGYGDSTALLRAMIEAQLPRAAFCAICDPDAVLAVKSMHHFRAAFEPIAREVLLVDSGSLCTEDYRPEMYKRARRPIWPFDAVTP